MAKKKPATVTAAVLAITLAQVVEATQAGKFLYTDAATHAPWLAAGHVEVNPNMVEEGTGKLATRSTEAGAEFVRSQTANPPTAAAAAPAKAKPTFEISSSVAIPAITGRGRVSGESVYPFDALEIGQSFFVPNSEEKPDAAKSMASTVSSANARYAEEIPGKTKINRKGETVPATRQLRQFVLRARSAQEEGGKAGVRIWRIEPKATPEAEATA